jgi:hypothetical protein
MVVGLVFALAPGCVYPSMTTGVVIVGRTVSGLMVLTPVPGMLNWIVLGPGVAAFEATMAARSEPVPVSAVLVTVKVLAIAPLASKRARQLKRTILFRFMREIVLLRCACFGDAVREVGILVFMVIAFTAII